MGDWENTTSVNNNNYNNNTIINFPHKSPKNSNELCFKKKPIRHEKTKL